MSYSYYAFSIESLLYRVIGFGIDFSTYVYTRLAILVVTSISYISRGTIKINLFSLV